MTNEEWQRKIEFIVELNANLTIKIDRISEKIDKLADDRAKERAQDAPRLKRVEESFILLVDMVRRQEERLDDGDKRAEEQSKNIDKLMDRLDEKIAALIDAQIATETAFHEKLRELTASQLETRLAVAVLSESQKNSYLTLDEKMKALTEAQIEISTAIRSLTKVQKKSHAALDEKMRGLTEAKAILIQLMRRHDERMEGVDKRAEAQSRNIAKNIDKLMDRFDEKLAALTDTQIAIKAGLDGKLRELAVSQIEAGAAMASLTEFQKKNQAKLDEKMKELADIQIETKIQLINFIKSQKRNTDRDNNNTQN